MLFTVGKEVNRRAFESERGLRPAFMSFALWPAADTVERFSAQKRRCGARRVGVWDSRYATHPLALRKLRALLADNDDAQALWVLLRYYKVLIISYNKHVEVEAPNMSFVKRWF